MVQCVLCYINDYRAEGVVPMHLDIPPENTIQKDLASHNLTVPQARYHEILE